MNNLYSRNEDIMYQTSGSSWTGCQDDERQVWLLKPSLHALSPPIQFDQDANGAGASPSTFSYTNRNATTRNIDFVVGKPQADTLKMATHDIPQTISIPVTPESIRTTIDFRKTVDMNDNDGADDMSCSVEPPPQEQQWDGSLSYLDGMADHASLMSNQERDGDDNSIGTFDISYCGSEAIGTFPNVDETTTVSEDDDSSMDSDDCDFVVVASGTSLPAKRKRVQQYGRTKFTCRLVRCTRKNV